MPLVSRRARIIGRRQEVWGGYGDASGSTWHFLTFEFDDGSREEFGVNGRQYGLLVEGDLGTLDSQGTSFKGFTREG